MLIYLNFLSCPQYDFTSVYSALTPFNSGDDSRLSDPKDKVNSRPEGTPPQAKCVHA